MKAQLGQMMRQAQMMQERLRKAQEEIATMEITGSAGAGMVSVTLSGKHQARKVSISPEALEEDREFLEDLIAAAINDASQKLEQATAEKMRAVTGGLQLPPGLSL